ncbi:uncharacterized protein EMH_0060960 [Eimeria mitis]|uniref:Uncharacterized protein n=1 Tax=Eimeria mitis TaxID=44415 RepID=U6K4Q3_9EIME|nr:uncharacterized protein EMH_0060960 [Eimeria mitis]CDJ30733.1 hypothetical protein, conserved [Eimeria mitis]
MDPQSGSLRGAAAAAGAPMGRSEGVNKLPAGEEVEVAGGTLPEGEEVGEEPQLPKEPCFARPRPFGHTLKELVEQLGALATAASATLKSLGSRGVAGLRGGASSSGVRGGEETGPVDQAQREVPATEPVPERPVSEEAPVVKSPPVEESLDEEGAAGELGETEDKPQLPKEPLWQQPQQLGCCSRTLAGVELQA